VKDARSLPVPSPGDQDSCCADGGRQAATPVAPAHPARVYSCWLGGKDHGIGDREAAEKVMRLRPEVVAAATANRSFGRRVTWYAAYGCGIGQFLDIGTGMPAPDPTHETAHLIRPASRVVYADHDPVVLAHARALLTARRGAQPCGYIDADARDPAGLLAKAAALLDFSQPVAVLLLAVPGISRRRLPPWVAEQAGRQVTGVPAMAVTCGSRRMSGSRTRRRGRCVFPRRV
jgi:hypothetical protein